MVLYKFHLSTILTTHFLKIYLNVIIITMMLTISPLALQGQMVWLYQLLTMKIMGDMYKALVVRWSTRVNWSACKIKHTPQCYFIHMDRPETEPVSPQWEASDTMLEQWNGLNTVMRPSLLLTQWNVFLSLRYSLSLSPFHSLYFPSSTPLLLPVSGNFYPPSHKWNPLLFQSFPSLPNFWESAKRNQQNNRLINVCGR
jgi:hypothetical protein